MGLLKDARNRFLSAYTRGNLLVRDTFCVQGGIRRATYILDPGAVGVSLPACATYAMCFFKYTAKYAGAAMFAFNLGGLLTFVNAVYYDVADKLFKANNITIARIFKEMGSNFVFIIFAYLINIVICIAASFFNQYRKVKEERGEMLTEAQEVVS